MLTGALDGREFGLGDLNLVDLGTQRLELVVRYHIPLDPVANVPFGLRWITGE